MSSSPNSTARWGLGVERVDRIGAEATLNQSMIKAL